MAEAVGAVLVLVTASLTRAVRGGAVAARAALSEPREGTILSVIHAFAEALQHDHGHRDIGSRSEEHTSELQSLMRISYAVFCLKKKKKKKKQRNEHIII